MRFIDLFCGIGGFRLAAERAGMECVFSSEISLNAIKVYSRHFNDLPHGDITQIHERDIPEHDFLFAGFPCQPFSVAGRRKGTEDDRGNLFLEILRVAKAKQPEIMVLENVPGILSAQKGEAIKAIIRGLYRTGYRVKYSILTASDFGVPQQRKRVFFVCIRKGSKFSYEPPEPTGMPCKLQSVLEESVDEKYVISEKSREAILGGKKWATARVHSAEGESLANTLTTKSAGGGNWRGNYVSGLIKIYDAGTQGYRVYSPAGVASTQMSGGGGLGAKTGLYEVGDNIRRLTPLECERVSGFPDGWTDLGLSDSARYVLLGNTVVPQVVSAVLYKLDNSIN